MLHVEGKSRKNIAKSARGLAIKAWISSCDIFPLRRKCFYRLGMCTRLHTVSPRFGGAMFLMVLPAANRRPRHRIPSRYPRPELPGRCMVGPAPFDAAVRYKTPWCSPHMFALSSARISYTGARRDAKSAEWRFHHIGPQSHVFKSKWDINVSSRNHMSVTVLRAHTHVLLILPGKIFPWT